MKKTTVTNKSSEFDLTLNSVINSVYQHVKILGFKKFGRTLHRFVDGNISQVINFQAYKPKFTINFGIGIPECRERVFFIPTIESKYYKEYECEIRSRISTRFLRRDTWFDTRKRASALSRKIIKELDLHVIPAFEALNNRQSILLHRSDYPYIDKMTPHQRLLDEAFIHGAMGNIRAAEKSFWKYYDHVVKEYEMQIKQGKRIFLRKGERVVWFQQDITAEKTGYVTIHAANHAHIDYLDELAKELNISRERTPTCTPESTLK